MLLSLESCTVSSDGVSQGCMGLPWGSVDPTGFPTLPSHHANLDGFGFISDNNQQSHHFAVPEKGKFTLL